MPQRHRRLRQRGQRRIQTRNGRGEGPGEDESAQPRRKDRGDPHGEHRIRVLRKKRSLRGRWRALLIVDKERRTDHEHEHGDKERDAAGDDGLRGIPRVATTKHALGHDLIGAECGHILERHGEQADPEGELHIGIGRKIEHPQLAGRTGFRDEHSETAVDVEHEHGQGEQTAADKDEKLDNVGPDHRGHATHQRPPDGKETDDDNAPLEGEAGHRPQNQRGDEQAHALSEG